MPGWARIQAEQVTFVLLFYGARGVHGAIQLQQNAPTYNFSVCQQLKIRMLSGQNCRSASIL